MWPGTATSPPCSTASPPPPHVVTVDHDGAPVYRVFVGAFLSHADAEARVHDEADLRGYVRSLV